MIVSAGRVCYQMGMRILLLHWLISAMSLLIVAYLIPGIYLEGFGAALIAAIVIGLANATLGSALKILTLPLSLVTFGLFFLVINAFMLQLAAALVRGFSVSGFWSAFFGAIALSLIGMALRNLLSNN